MKARCPFPTPSPLQKQYLHELSRVAKRCYDRGWSWGTAGNFSIRGSDGLVWMSPTGLCKGELDVANYVPVDLESETAVERFSKRPSAETPVHLGIYKTQPSAGCVVHTHPHESVALSLELEEFSFSGEEMIKALGTPSHLDEIKIKIMDNPSPDQMKNFSSKVVSGVSSPARMVILKGHGVYAWGHTPLEAMGYLEALEFLCQSKRFRK